MIIDEGITQGQYVETTDNTFSDLKRFQDFLYRYSYERDIYASNSCPTGQFFATAKTHKFQPISEVNLDQLKRYPIIDQTGFTFTKYQRFIARYLIPLTKNEYNINNTLSFLELLKNASFVENLLILCCSMFSCINSNT